MVPWVNLSFHFSHMCNASGHLKSTCILSVGRTERSPERSVQRVCAQSPPCAQPHSPPRVLASAAPPPLHTPSHHPLRPRPSSARPPSPPCACDDPPHLRVRRYPHQRCAARPTAPPARTHALSQRMAQCFDCACPCLGIPILSRGCGTFECNGTSSLSEV